MARGLGHRMVLRSHEVVANALLACPLVRVEAVRPQKDVRVQHLVPVPLVVKLLAAPSYANGVVGRC